MSASHPALPSIYASGVAQRADDRFALQLRLAALTVLLLPLNWLLGTTLFWVFSVALMLARSSFRASSIEWTLVHLCGALMLGFAVAMAGGVPEERLVGPIFNVAIILMMVAFFNFGRKAQAARSAPHAPADRIYRMAFWCFGIQAAVIGGSQAFISLTGMNEFSIPTLIGAAGELPGILSYYSSNFLSIRDGFEVDADPRISGVGIYPTEGAILVLTVGLLAAIHACQRGRYALAVAVEVVIAVALVVMASRTTLAAYVVSLPLLFALGGRRLLGLILMCSPVIACVALLAAIYGPEFVGIMFEAANQSRADSSATRFNSYRLAIAMVLDTNPLTGLGILPKIESLSEIPIGSHSSWTSIFTRGGFIALAVWVAFNATLIVRVVRSQWRLYSQHPGIDPSRRLELVNLSRVAVVVMFWWLTEDFDFPAHHVMIAGLSLGLFWGALETPEPVRRDHAMA